MMKRTETKSIPSRILATNFGRLLTAVVAIAVCYGAYAVDKKITQWEPQKNVQIIPVVTENAPSESNTFSRDDRPTPLPGDPTALQLMSIEAPLVIPENAEKDPVDVFSQKGEYEKQLLQFPEDAATRFKLAQLMIELGDNDAAIKQFEESAKTPTLAGESWFELARINARNGNVADAVTCLQNAEQAGFHDLVGLLADPDLAALQTAPEMHRF